MTQETRVKEDVLGFIADNFLFGDRASLPGDHESLIEHGLIDSTGVLELIAFLEESYGIAVADEDMVPENLDSVARIASFVGRKAAPAEGHTAKVA